MEEFADSLQHGMQQETDANLANLSGEKLTSVVNSVKKISEEGMKFAKLHKYKNMYTIFSTGLAVTTNIVAPLLELIIIFLPDIISLGHKLFGESQENAMQHQIEERVIPQICEKLRPQIEQAATDMEAELVQEAKQEYQTAMAREEEALQRIEQERADCQQQIEQQKEDLTAAAAKLQALQDKVAAVKNRFK